MRVTIRAALALLLLALPTSVFATPGALSPVKRTLSVRTAVPRTCHSSLRAPGRGVALTAYRAPMSGFVDVRGAASDRSDWDLVVFDAATHRVLASSESFGSHEVAQSWVGAGQRLAIQGCRHSGTARRLAVTIRFLDLVRPKSNGTPMLARVPIA